MAVETGYFTEKDSAEVVAGRISEDTDPRLRQIMTVLVKHMHAAVKELELTEEEWFEGIKFLTETGHKCDEWRQEFILLSDVLGVSMLVDAINNRKPSGASESTVLGPFHVADAPELEMGSDICLDQKGEPMLVEGRILDTRGNPVDGAKLDVWQANDEGFYDVQQKGIQPDFNLRGVFRTSADGTYWFKGVKPKYYPIPGDGPVGRMLAALGRHCYRPAHLHYIISAEGYKSLTTHIFDPDDPYIHSDAVFGVKESLMARFDWIEDPASMEARGMTTPFYHVIHDFVLVPA
ncbi:MAG: intradiol ring-cleavage dioxygenase [Rhodobacteraceae bacterium]|nr:intradiol ring-cleavage dioxygenase [Paracoccaceae bacterium]MYF47177.1 intradiol ring-cleavage dioxygenase [Paracoccaceae bacterium]MYI92528.1 intradiol ring-cleavage dioxygenase [Paracoccaceae bacterium]